VTARSRVVRAVRVVRVVSVSLTGRVVASSSSLDARVVVVRAIRITSVAAGRTTAPTANPLYHWNEKAATLAAFSFIARQHPRI